MPRVLLPSGKGGEDSGGGGGSTALTEQIATEKAIIMAIALG